MPLIHTLFMCSKLNVDDFSVLAGLLGYVDSTQEVENNLPTAKVKPMEKKCLVGSWIYFCVVN